MTVEENLLMGGYINDKNEESYLEVEKIFEKYERLKERRIISIRPFYESVQIVAPV